MGIDKKACVDTVRKAKTQAVQMWIDTKVHPDVPDSTGRLDKEMASYALLKALDIQFVRLDHDPAYTVDACVDIEKRLGIEISKNLFLSDARRSRFYLLMMPGNKRYRAGELSAQLNTSRLSFASEADLLTHLDLLPGSVSMLGLMNDMGHAVTLLVDKDLLDSEYIGCHPCVNTTSLKLRLDDLLTKFLPYTGHEPVFVTLSWGDVR